MTTFSHVPALNLTENSWNTKTPMKQARDGLGVVVVDNKIYAIGGVGTMGAYVGTNECYDPKTDKWITLASMPTPQAYFAIAAYQGKIYCISDEAVSATEVYDIASNSWSKASILDTLDGGRLYAHVVDGKIFVLNISTLRLYMYNPVTDAWTEKTRIPTNIATHAGTIVSTLVDDKINVIGIFYLRIPDSFKSTMMTKVVVYDPKTDVWTEVNSIPTTNETFFYDVAAGANTGRYAPKRIYVFQETRTTVYDPIKNTWYTAEPMLTARRQMGVAVVDDIFYVIGGAVHGYGFYPDDPLPIPTKEYSSVNEQYTPGYLEPLLPTTTPSATITPSNSVAPSKPNPSDSAKPLSNPQVIAVVIILIVGLGVAGLVFSKKKRKTNPQQVTIHA